MGGCICSATKKVRKVDIRYAMRSFLIFEYTFGTHLSQNYTFSPPWTIITDTSIISDSIVVYYQVDTYNLAKPQINLIPQFYHFSFIGMKVHIQCEMETNRYQKGTHLIYKVVHI